jgi:hypothetical protein
MKRQQFELYNILRSIDGGPSRKWLLSQLKDEGIKAKPAHSVYVGHTAIQVYGNRRIQRKAERIIFGR